MLFVIIIYLVIHYSSNCCAGSNLIFEMFCTCKPSKLMCSPSFSDLLYRFCYWSRIPAGVQASHQRRPFEVGRVGGTKCSSSHIQIYFSLKDCRTVYQKDFVPLPFWTIVFSCLSRRGVWRANATSPQKQLLLEWSEGPDSSVHPVVWGKTPFSTGESSLFI